MGCIRGLFEAPWDGVCECPASLCSLGMSRVPYPRERGRRLKEPFHYNLKTLFVSKFEGKNTLLCLHLGGGQMELLSGLELCLATCLSLLAVLPLPSRSGTEIGERIAPGSL